VSDAQQPPPPPDPNASAPPPLPDPGAQAAPPADDASGAFDPAEALRKGSEQHSMALKHETQASRTYPCEACGGELHFDIPTQMLKCQHCGNTHELVDVDGDVKERDLREALALVRQGKMQRSANFLTDEKEIVCQNCGGHTTFTGSLTANKCPYCATPIQRDDVHAAPERLPVDAVLPFSVDQKSAEDLIDKWINGRWFAPSEFKTYNRTGSFQSVYMAYFTYDADTQTHYSGQRGITRTRTVGHGDNRRTETYTTWHHVSGVVGNVFDDIPILANTGFEKKRIDKLEPWPTETAKPYSAEFAAGHLARTYDHDVEECLGEATSIMENDIRATVRRDIGGDQQRISSMNINWREMTYKHMLLPLWLLTVIYDGRPFQVYINGVTGEVHGARPYSKVKIITAIALALLVVILIAVAVSAAGGGDSP
jgi:DNA-directed RNA polymerase subunit RPC12/RpoP